jgi:hypothetical protein
MNLQAYAQHRKALGLRGGSHVAVLKAIESGRLTKRSATKEDGKWVIRPEAADKEWAKNTVEQQPEKATEMVKEAARQEMAAPRPQPQRRDVSLESETKGLPDRAASRAVRELYQARLAKLEYEERNRQRVPADEVKREAFSLGKTIRESVLNIPDRISTELAALADAAEIHRVLTVELRQALEELAGA